MKHSWNTLKTLLKHSRNSMQTPMKHLWHTQHPLNTMETPLKHSWNTPMLQLHQYKKKVTHTLRYTHWVISSLLELLIAAKKVQYSLCYIVTLGKSIFSNKILNISFLQKFMVRMQCLIWNGCIEYIRQVQIDNTSFLLSDHRYGR